eukprot:scaffold74215_cov16-Tisochrysis_lutea.AAC.2
MPSSTVHVRTHCLQVLAVDKLGSLFIFCMNTGELIASKKLAKAPINQICAVLGRWAGLLRGLLVMGLLVEGTCFVAANR